MHDLWGRGWRLVRELTVAALLLGTLPVEGAVHLVPPSQEPAVSCTVDGAPSERVARDRDILIPDGPRVATGERGPGSDLDVPHVCPLHPEQEPVPPRAQP